MNSEHVKAYRLMLRSDDIPQAVEDLHHQVADNLVTIGMRISLPLMALIAAIAANQESDGRYDIRYGERVLAGGAPGTFVCYAIGKARVKLDGSDKRFQVFNKDEVIRADADKPADAE